MVAQQVGLEIVVEVSVSSAAVKAQREIQIWEQNTREAAKMISLTRVFRATELTGG